MKPKPRRRYIWCCLGCLLALSPSAACDCLTCGGASHGMLYVWRREWARAGA